MWTFQARTGAGHERRAVARDSHDLGRTPPILARANDRDITHRRHIEKVVVDADQHCTPAGNRRAEHWQIGGIAAKV